jgi:hypothetical protein
LFANVADGVVVIDIGNYHPELRDGRIPAIEQRRSLEVTAAAVTTSERSKTTDRTWFI